MSIVDQGYAVEKFMDSQGNSAFVVPCPGGVVGAADLSEPSFVARLSVSSAQLLALKTTPLQMTFVAPTLVPPADVANTNWIIVPETISLHYTYGAAAYTINAGTLRLSYGPATNALYLCADQSALLTNVTNQVIPSIAVTLPGTLTEATGLAQNIYLVNTGTANFTLGGGSLVATLVYSIVTM